MPQTPTRKTSQRRRLKFKNRNHTIPITKNTLINISTTRVVTSRTTGKSSIVTRDTNPKGRDTSRGVLATSSNSTNMRLSMVVTNMIKHIIMRMVTTITMDSRLTKMKIGISSMEQKVVKKDLTETSIKITGTTIAKIIITGVIDISTNMSTRTKITMVEGRTSLNMRRRKHNRNTTRRLIRTKTQSETQIERFAI